MNDTAPKGSASPGIVQCDNCKLMTLSLAEYAYGRRFCFNCRNYHIVGNEQRWCCIYVDRDAGVWRINAFHKTGWSVFNWTSTTQDDAFAVAERWKDKGIKP